VEHLFSAWPKLADQVRQAKQVLFLTDFDGTLAPIVDKPELAVMPEETRLLLKTLARQRRFKVGIISGRALADLKKMVGLEGIIYAGNHGFEIEGPGWNFVSPIADELKPIFRVVRQVLTLTLGTIKGVLVEDKGITLSVHYRQVEKANAKDVRNLVERAISGPTLLGLLKVTSGKEVYEVRPAINWNKGRAIRLLMKKYGRGGRNSGLIPIYLGDDLTDEDGFQAIEKYGSGISVYVGGIRHNSAARYYLNSTDEVHQFMVELLEYAQRGLPCEEYSTI
jgi:trehalose-phosphatase